MAKKKHARRCPECNHEMDNAVCGNCGYSEGGRGEAMEDDYGEEEAEESEEEEEW